MNRFRSLLTIALMVCAGRASAQSIAGTVRDAESGELLPAATVRIVGTDQGTIANTEGRFGFVLPPGSHRLAVSFVGYRSDTILVRVPGAVFLDVRLVASPVQMPEVIVSGEDPAYEIMRRVIARKKEWLSSLTSYTFEAFTRQVFRKETTIVSIVESYTTGYWKEGDTLREVVRQKRQTENIPSASNVASVGQILNFYDDEIRLGGHRFVGPTALNAHEYYDFRLEGTRDSDGRTLYIISLNPNSRTTPLFRGRLHVVDGRYVLASVDVAPNEAFSIPFAPDIVIRYQQQFAPIRRTYWLPVDIRASVELEVSLLVLSLPRMRFESVSTLYEYDVNTRVPDSVFTKGKRVFQDTTATVIDSAFWAERDVLPLTLEQRIAFEQIDSSQTMQKVFRPTTPVGDIDGEGFSFMRYVDARFTRVEGGYVGGKFSADSIAVRWDVSGFAGYGFGDRRGQWGLTVLRWADGRTTALGAQAFSRTERIYDRGKHPGLVNSINALVFRNDYFDYVRTLGAGIFLRQTWSGSLTSDIGIWYERFTTAAVATDFSLLSRSIAYRPNPPAVPGDIAGLAGSLSSIEEGLPAIFTVRNRIDLEAEFGYRRFEGMQNYVRLSGSGTIRFDTFLRRSLFPAYASVSLAAGWTSSGAPTQKHFTPETQSSGFGPMGVLRAARVKEFAGKEFVFASFEHNFRNAPFLWLGIPFLYTQGWDLISFVSVARTASPGGPTPLGSATRGIYGEVGLGVNHLLKILRVDLSYRLYSPRGLSVTLSIGQLL